MMTGISNVSYEPNHSSKLASVVSSDPEVDTKAKEESLSIKPLPIPSDLTQTRKPDTSSFRTRPVTLTDWNERQGALVASVKPSPKNFLNFADVVSSGAHQKGYLVLKKNTQT